MGSGDMEHNRDEKLNARLLPGATSRRSAESQKPKAKNTRQTRSSMRACAAAIGLEWVAKRKCPPHVRNDAFDPTRSFRDCNYRVLSAMSLQRCKLALPG